MNPGFFELTIILSAAAVFSVLAKILKQPTILAYLAVGMTISLLQIFNLNEFDIFELFSEMGIMLLLFLVGLEINYSSLKTVGKTSLVLGLGQVFFTSIVGFVIARFLGFEPTASLYIGVGLCFSSTIIIVKLLTDKKDLNSLYGKISIGFLLVQDIVAILMLVVLSSLQTGGGFNILDILLALGKAIGLFALMLWLGRKAVPVIFDRVAYSQEILLIASLAWVFALAVIVHQIDFSIEIAGFLAGIALANSSEHFQIANRIRPLRDFFIMLFFVSLGTTFTFSSLQGLGVPIVIFSLFVLIGNPIIVISLMGVMGYRKRTGFLTGLTVAQVSEFSLILMAVGLELGHINQQALTLVTAVSVTTITLSTYLITYGPVIYKYFERVLSIFERKRLHEPRITNGIHRRPIVLIGFHRTGRSLAHNLNKKDLLIVDFDPNNIEHVQRHGYDYIFGDISDEEIYDASGASKSQLIISTSPDMEDNLILLANISKAKRKPKSVVRAETEDQASKLYEHGADYVLLPHLSSGHALGQAIAKTKGFGMLQRLKQKDLSVLKAYKA